MKALHLKKSEEGGLVAKLKLVTIESYGGEGVGGTVLQENSKSLLQNICTAPKGRLQLIKILVFFSNKA